MASAGGGTRKYNSTNIRDDLKWFDKITARLMKMMERRGTRGVETACLGRRENLTKVSKIWEDKRKNGNIIAVWLGKLSNKYTSYLGLWLEWPYISIGTPAQHTGRINRKCDGGEDAIRNFRYVISEFRFTTQQQQQQTYIFMVKYFFFRFPFHYFLPSFPWCCLMVLPLGFFFFIFFLENRKMRDIRRLLIAPWFMHSQVITLI